MIPEVKAKLLEGKRGLIVGIANENSIAWGCAKAFRVRRGARGDLSQRQGEEIRRTARARSRGADRDAARRSSAGRNGGGVRAHQEGVGPARFRRPFNRILAEGGATGARRRRVT